LKFDHIAIVVANISKSIEWYSERFPEFKLLYSDATWAIANIGEL
jgi:catechol 2,3-dioxygenase-like lactoylglutathione lyase family enzyme